MIIVRSMTESDLGIFSAHRVHATSKQRAIALTAPAVRVLLSSRLYAEQVSSMDVICVYGQSGTRELRHIGKVGKNWRLGGRKIEAGACAFLDSKDFVLIRTVARNDGNLPLLMTFVGRQRERLLHAGIVASLAGRFTDSTAILEQGTDTFEALAGAFPSIEPSLAVGLAGDTEMDDTPTWATGSDGR
ncbi:hypothetical protein RFM68_21065 [Mesorhizobium sp. MSK_1335]|uniref:Uncharacterized protein n=1 Tax=Mesorhizobium montanum TaxID=3072323 RepID=A0ABU4ZNP1_9HYPH|nr:hypothetical protein [Mesorhizobium sp. MSK_1335]MDX8526996.1 hypothetical protein [Mesorhizobium sp. MSK_1335]